MKRPTKAKIWWSIILSCLLLPMISIYAWLYFDPFFLYQLIPYKIETTPTHSEFSMHINVEDEYQKSKCAFIRVKKDNLPRSFRMRIVVDNPTTSMDTTFADMAAYGSYIDGEVVEHGPRHARYQWYIPRDHVKGFTITFIPKKAVFKGDIVFAVNYWAECPS